MHNVLLGPDLCDRLFQIIKLMNLGHISLFQKGFCTVYFSDKKENEVTIPHSAHRKHAFLVKTSKKPSQRNYHLGRKLLCIIIP